MALKCGCEDETVMATQGEGPEVSTCSCAVPGRKSLWVGLGLLAAAGGVLLYLANRERERIEEQVKSTLPLQT